MLSEFTDLDHNTFIELKENNPRTIVYNKGKFDLRIGDKLIDRDTFFNLSKKHSFTYKPNLSNELARLRRSVLVSSYLYYELNVSFISDSEWDRRAKRIVELQSLGVTSKVLKNEFESFTDNTGFHLNYRTPEIMNLGDRLKRDLNL